VTPRERYTVHNEEGNIERIIPHVRDVLERHMSPSTPELLEKVAALVATASGEWLASPDRQFGLAIDDIIARAHDSRCLPPKRTSPTITKLLNAPVGVFRGSNAKMDCEL
jgi:hypothetical protein